MEIKWNGQDQHRLLCTKNSPWNTRKLDLVGSISRATWETLQGRQQHIPQPLIRTITAIADAIVDPAARDRTHRERAVELSQCTRIRRRLVTAVLRTIAVVVVNSVERDLLPCRDAAEFGCIEPRVVVQLINVNTAGRIPKYCIIISRKVRNQQVIFTELMQIEIVQKGILSLASTRPHSGICSGVRCGSHGGIPSLDPDTPCRRKSIDSIGSCRRSGTRRTPQPW